MSCPFNSLNKVPGLVAQGFVCGLILCLGGCSAGIGQHTLGQQVGERLAGHLSKAMNLGFKCPSLFNEGAGHPAVVEGLLGWKDLGLLLRPEICVLGKLESPSCGSIIELAPLGSG